MRAVLARLSPSPGTWIQSPGYDLAFFVLAPLVTLPIVLIEVLGWGYIAVGGALLATAHYFSTFTFYFWDENHAYHRAHWIAFFAGPAVIAAAYLALVALEARHVVFSVLFFWNTYHVARQSCGILSVYRHRAGVLDPRQKALANAAIVGVSLWLALWNIETHPDVFLIFSAVSPRLALALRLGLGVVAAVAVARLAWSLWGRSTTGGRLALPEMAFASTSMLLFTPFLWVPTSAGAMYVMLLPHYVQYLGLVWLLHRRKFRAAFGSVPQRCLQYLSTHTAVLVLILFIASFGVAGARSVFTHAGRFEVFQAFYLILAFTHFYLDALFWAFKDPHVRRMLAPYLMQGAVTSR